MQAFSKSTAKIMSASVHSPIIGEIPATRTRMYMRGLLNCLKKRRMIPGSLVVSSRFVCPWLLVFICAVVSPDFWVWSCLRTASFSRCARSRG